VRVDWEVRVDGAVRVWESGVLMELGSAGLQLAL